MAYHGFSIKRVSRYNANIWLYILWHLLLALLISVPLVMALFATTVLSH